jgi:hypothetical protein
MRMKIPEHTDDWDIFIVGFQRLTQGIGRLFKTQHMQVGFIDQELTHRISRKQIPASEQWNLQKVQPSVSSRF